MLTVTKEAPKSKSTLEQHRHIITCKNSLCIYANSGNEFSGNFSFSLLPILLHRRQDVYAPVILTRYACSPKPHPLLTADPRGLPRYMLCSAGVQKSNRPLGAHTQVESRCKQAKHRQSADLFRIASNRAWSCFSSPLLLKGSQLVTATCLREKPGLLSMLMELDAPGSAEP